MAASDTVCRIFEHDTVRIKYQPESVGVAVRTWQEFEAPYDGVEILKGRNVSQNAYDQYYRDGERPPRNHFIFQPISLVELHQLLREDDVEVIDRAMSFGTIVKKKVTDAMTGIVVKVGAYTTLRPSFIPKEMNSLSMVRPNIEFVGEESITWDLVNNVPAEELRRAEEWERGEFVIWKNSWVGMVEMVNPDVAMLLSNGTVVIPEDCDALTDMYGKADGPVDQPVELGIGIIVRTTKGNLRRGRWLKGAYDPSVDPSGAIVGLNTGSLTIRWLCQNLAVDNFVAVPRPGPQLFPNDFTYLRSAHISERGFTPPEVCQTLGEVAIGQKVRFNDLDAAVAKYDGRSVEEGGLGLGKVYKIPRVDTAGFDVNAFTITHTKSYVDVLWQDLSVSRHDSKDLCIYWNMDDHDLWPGDFVIIKDEVEQSGAPTNATNATTGSTVPTGPDDPTTNGGGPNATASYDSMDCVTPKKIGVVQAVNANERVANVRWFENPKIQLAGSFIVPGSKTGKLSEEVEEVSVYDVLPHQALGVTRGAIVLILPEHVESPSNTSDRSAMQIASSIMMNIADMLRQTTSPNATQASDAVTTMLQNIHNGVSPSAEQASAQAGGQPWTETGQTTWIGEVMDLGLDGLITVRLNALDEIRDVRLPIERITVVYSPNGDDDLDDGHNHDHDADSMDVENSDTMMDDDSDGFEDDYRSGHPYDTGFGLMPGNARRDEPVAEELIYAGGERMDDGDDDAWSTDQEGGLGDIDNEMDIDTDTPAHSTTNNADKPVEPLRDTSADPPASTTTSSPSSFEILESDFPTSHHYYNTSPTNLTPQLLRRIRKEHGILTSSLPPDTFVRTWDSRLDCLRLLILGPRNTPYTLAPFLFDIHLPSTFPHSPPVVYFHSWTHGVGRVNPNLYEDGKVCLSLLGTWHSEQSSETWFAGRSSLLQVVVSLMALVLVREPYYNEAGFGALVDAPDVAGNARMYAERAFVLSRGFVATVLQRTQMVEGVEEIVEWAYRGRKRGGGGLLEEIVRGCEVVVERAERERGVEEKEVKVDENGVGRVTAGGIILLKRHLNTLKGLLEREREKAKVEDVEEA